ncbi:MAG: helix-turn-helix transcriptional regulator [Rhodospirillaceae bacterium]|nr:helix-turn-helix transcriptional regulator [Rhodospirillaceae bacterium]
MSASASQLDATFAALADPTRRALLARLEHKDNQSVSTLAQPFAMSLPAVMKHLDILDDAGLIRRAKVGRTVTCTLVAKPMEDAMAWLARYERFWTQQFDRLAAYLDSEQDRPAAKRRRKKPAKPNRT